MTKLHSTGSLIFGDCSPSVLPRLGASLGSPGYEHWGTADAPKGGYLASAPALKSLWASSVSSYTRGPSLGGVAARGPLQVESQPQCPHLSPKSGALMAFQPWPHLCWFTYFSPFEWTRLICFFLYLVILLLLLKTGYLNLMMWQFCKPHSSPFLRVFWFLLLLVFIVFILLIVVGCAKDLPEVET